MPGTPLDEHHRDHRRREHRHRHQGRRLRDGRAPAKTRNQGDCAKHASSCRDNEGQCDRRNEARFVRVTLVEQSAGQPDRDPHTDRQYGQRHHGICEELSGRRRPPPGTAQREPDVAGRREDEGVENDGEPVGTGSTAVRSGLVDEHGHLAVSFLDVD